MTHWQATEIQNLVRNVKSGRFYGRFRVLGKRKYVSLRTDRKDIAELRLSDEKKRILQVRRLRKVLGGAEANIGELVAAYKLQVRSNDDLSAVTRERYCELIDFVARTWPGFDRLAPERITRDQVIAWRDAVRKRAPSFKPPGARGISRKYTGNSPATINKAIDTLRRVLQLAVDRGQLVRNPIAGRGVKLRAIPRKPVLPDNDQLLRIFAEMEKGGWKGREAADFCRFLAFTGARLREAAALTWADVDLARSRVHIRGTKSLAADRTIPLIAEARALLGRIWAVRQEPVDRAPADRVFRVSEGEKSLTRACATLGLPRLP